MRATRLLAAILLAALATACSGDKPDPVGGRCPPDGLLGEGDLIPMECSFPDLAGGERLVLGELRGRPAVLNFWASWCTYCLKEMPAFERVHKALGDRVSFVGADLVGVDGETEALGRSYASARGVTYRLIVDSDGLLYSHFVLMTATRTPVLPTTILVDAFGRVVFRKFGPLEEKELRETLRDKLGVE